MFFHNGAKVVCVNQKPLPGNTVAPPVKKGEDYEVKGYCYDIHGNQHLDVGLASKYNFIRSHESGEELPDGDKIHWCHPSRFKLK